MGFDTNEISEKSKGGTELMRQGLEQRIDSQLLEQFQIIPSRVRELHEDKIRILWLHDLPGDPESNHLHNGGHEKFHLLVFVSNWQMQRYVEFYRIPWSKCLVIENAIEPIDEQTIDKSTDKIKLIYHTTPHRGLAILLPVFDQLCAKYDNLELDVYSSFKIYGWENRDKDYEQLFDMCRNHPKINYHGTVSNDEVRSALAKAHIFAYPSIWQETACLSLMEAMSAKCVCVHPNFGALFETASGCTVMYQWHEDAHMHAHILQTHLEFTIQGFQQSTVGIEKATSVQRSFVTLRNSWERIVPIWTNLLNALLSRYPDMESRKQPGPMFVYRT